MRRVYRLILYAILVLLLSQPSYAAEPRETKRVLVLYSEDKAHPAHELTDKGIRSAFRSNKLFVVRQYNEYFDISRFSGPGHARVMADYLNRKYAGTRIDAIITVYPAAMEFLHEGKLFTGVPIVACEIIRATAEKLERSPWRSSTTGTLQGDNAARLVESALRLRPRTKRAALVSGTAPNDAHSELVIRNGLKPYAGEVELIDLTKLPMQETLARVGSLPPDTIILYSAIFRDGANQVFVPREALSLISAAANAPVFGFYESYMGYGIVGGRLDSYEMHGREAAAFAIRIMGGESPASIPFSGERLYVDLYDWKQLRRWNLSEAALPKGSVVINKEFTLWDVRYYAIGALALLLLQSLLIAGLITQRRRRRKADETLRERLRFERLLSGLSAKFVNLPPDRVDSEIEQGLRQILELFHVDRCALLRSLPDKSKWQITHAAFAEDVPPVPVGTELPVSISPWSYEKLVHRREVVSFSRVDDLPAEANVDKKTWIEWGIRSNLIIPILIGEPVDHVIGINSVNSERIWPEEIISRLRLLGEILVNALERKQAEEKIHRAHNELLRIERSYRMNELTASLAHEINQPLAAILSNAQAALRFLKSDKPDLNEFQEIIRDIISDDQRAGNVIRSLRSMMKREEGEKKSLILNDVLNDVIQIFRSEAIFRNLSIEAELDGYLLPVFSDKVQLQQVALNIIMNAAEAMSQNPPERRKIILRTKLADQSIRVSVRDFGPGINQTDLQRVFDPFFTTKDTGLGMGLAVTASIVKEHGGRIWAENNPDGGATFFIDLPVYKSGE